MAVSAAGLEVWATILSALAAPAALRGPTSRAQMLRAGAWPPHSRTSCEFCTAGAGSVRSLSVCPGACGDLLELLALGVP